MQHFALEFESEADMRETVDKLWAGRKTTGELTIRTTGGRYRVEVHAERDIRESVLEKLKGQRVEL